MSEEDVDAARNPNTSAEDLVCLSRHERYQVRDAVARNPNTPVATLTNLSQDENSYVRYAVARNFNTLVATLLALSKDEDSLVRGGVADNPHTPAETLVNLAQDIDEDLRRDVASNRRTPTETLVSLAQDENEWVRDAIARNPNTPIETLVSLSNDDDDLVCQGVVQSLNTPVEILVALSRDENIGVRCVVASNPNTPTDCLVTLAQDSNDYVREQVAGNLHSPTETLVALAKDENERVRDAVAKNPNTPEGTLVTWWDLDIIGKAVTALSGDATKEQILQLMQDDEAEIVFLASANSILDQPDIERIAGLKSSWLPEESFFVSGFSLEELTGAVRKSAQLAGLACNPNAPVQLLTDLSMLPQTSTFEYWLDLPRHCAILRQLIDSSHGDNTQVGLATHPGMRLVLGQEELYEKLLAEARSRKTDSRRLLEIYETQVLDIQDRMGYPNSGGYEWYDDIRSFYLFHSPVEDKLTAGLETEAYSDAWTRPVMDESLMEILRNSPHVWNPIRSFAIMEGRWEFSYVNAEVIANPAATIGISTSNFRHSEELTLFDQLREPLQPALHKWLEIFVNEPDSPYSCDVLKWIELVKSMRIETNLIETIERLLTHDLLTMLPLNEDDDPDWAHHINPQYLDESEIGGLDAVVSRIAPYLGGTDIGVLQDEFKLDSKLIKQAILLNPYCPANLRDSVGDDEELFIPSNLEIARIAAYAGFYEKIPELLGGSHEIGELLEICDEHVSKAVTEHFRLNQSE